MFGSQAQLIWGVLFGAIGAGYFVYGKRQQAFVPLFAGIALCVFPFFITNTYALVAVGVAICAVPYFVRA